jgi:hypothetical protein
MDAIAELLSVAVQGHPTLSKRASAEAVARGTGVAFVVDTLPSSLDRKVNRA